MLWKLFPKERVRLLLFVMKKNSLFILVGFSSKYVFGIHPSTMSHSVMCSIESTVPFFLQKTHGVFLWYLLAVWNPLKTKRTHAAWIFGGSLSPINFKLEKTWGTNLKLLLVRPFPNSSHLCLKRASHLKAKAWGSWKKSSSTSYNCMFPCLIGDVFCNFSNQPFWWACKFVFPKSTNGHVSIHIYIYMYTHIHIHTPQNLVRKP